MEPNYEPVFEKKGKKGIIVFGLTAGFKYLPYHGKRIFNMVMGNNENANEYNLMNSFMITGGTVPITYPEISIDQLENLNINDYKNRVIDFINYSASMKICLYIMK